MILICFSSDSLTSRYVGPRKAETPYDVPVPRGGGICKYKQELVVGNVSKWLEEGEGMATHKWMLYVRGGKDKPDLSDVVSRVQVRIPNPQSAVHVSQTCYPQKKEIAGLVAPTLLLFLLLFFFPRLNCTPPTPLTIWWKSPRPRFTSRGAAGVSDRVYLPKQSRELGVVLSGVAAG